MSEVFRELPQDACEGAGRVMQVVFSLDDEPEDGPGGHQDPYSKYRRTYGCELDGVVVSAVELMRRWAHVPGGVWSFGAIAGVSTLKEFRGRGYSSKLLKMAMEQMKKDNLDFGLLLTGINPFYEKLGWWTVPRGYFEAEINEIKEKQSVEFSADVPWAEVADLYNAFNANRPFTIDRKPEYWEKWAGCGLHGSKWIFIRDGKKITAYAAIREDKANKRIQVMEYGWNQGDINSCRKLANQILSIPASFGYNKILSFTPLDPDFMAQIEVPGVTVTRNLENGLMALPVTRPAEELKQYCNILKEGTGAFYNADFF